MEASTYTVGELLGELFPGCDIDTGLKRIQTFVETLADRMPAVIERVVIPACEMVERLEKLPPVSGYEPLLVERCHYPPIARGLSHWIIRSGKDQANKARVQRTVVDTIRFLAKPGRQKRSISRRRRCCWRCATQHPTWMTSLTASMSMGSRLPTRSKARLEATLLLVSAWQKSLRLWRRDCQFVGVRKRARRALRTNSCSHWWRTWQGKRPIPMIM